MRAIVCDKCGLAVDGEKEVRYLGISRLIKDDEGIEVEKPVMPTLEVCAVCATNIRELIGGFDGCDNK